MELAHLLTINRNRISIVTEMGAFSRPASLTFLPFDQSNRFPNIFRLLRHSAGYIRNQPFRSALRNS